MRHVLNDTWREYHNLLIYNDIISMVIKSRKNILHGYMYDDMIHILLFMFKLGYFYGKIYINQRLAALLYLGVILEIRQVLPHKDKADHFIHVFNPFMILRTTP